MRNKTTRIVLLFLVLAVAGFFIYKLAAKSNNPKEPEAPRGGATAGAGRGGGAGRPILVDAYVVTPIKLDENIEASGTLQSNEEVELKPEITGRITKIFFKEGAKVSKGTLLIKLYDGDILAQNPQAGAATAVGQNHASPPATAVEDQRYQPAGCGCDQQPGERLIQRISNTTAPSCRKRRSGRPSAAPSACAM